MILVKLKQLVMDILYRNWSMETKLISAAMLNRDTFLPYKNFCQGKREIVVCGAGPSLRNYQPIDGALHIALNRAFLYEKVKFDFIFAQDYDGIKMVTKELKNYKGNQCVKLLGLSDVGKKEIPESYAIQCGAKRFATDSFIFHNGYRSEFVTDLAFRPIGGMPNLGMSVLQFALYMNPSRIYLAGCDMSGTHFANGNQTAGELKKERRELHACWVDDREKLLNKWREIRAAAKRYYPDIEIVSVNPEGLKGVFRDFYQK